jgi:hypothetical protein
MARPRKDPNEARTTTQVSLRGRTASVFLELASLRGGEPAASMRWIIESWLAGEGRKILLEQYGINVLAHGPASNVVSIEGRTESGSVVRRTR